MRPTFITGMARIGTLMRQATIRIASEDASGQRTYVCAMVDGDTFDPRNAQWRTLSRSRNAAAAAIHQDRRLSASGPSLFAYSTVSITKRDGTLIGIGGEEPFDAFVQHMLRVGGDSTWRGETADDRIAVAAEVLAQTSWTE